MRTLLLLAALLPVPALALDIGDASRSTYRIFTLSTDNRVSTGSGVQVGHNRILTNCHVVANAKEVVVEYSPSGKRYSASGVSTDQGRDACVLEVRDAPGRSIPQARFVSNGDTVYVLGYPESAKLVASEGKVMEAEFRLRDDTAILSSNYCAPGASGGPMINNKGELVGLIFAGHNRFKTCLAVPAYYIQRVQAGTIVPFSIGAPIGSKGSVYHDTWQK